MPSFSEIIVLPMPRRGVGVIVGVEVKTGMEVKVGVGVRLGVLVGKTFAESPPISQLMLRVRSNKPIPASQSHFFFDMLGEKLIGLCSLEAGGELCEGLDSGAGLCVEAVFTTGSDRAWFASSCVPPVANSSALNKSSAL